jgi:hypothetical protein
VETNSWGPETVSGRPNSKDELLAVPEEAVAQPDPQRQLWRKCLAGFARTVG